MRILLTNDDGIRAEGLIALSRELSREHEVWILAPDRERSGVSHAMTLRDPGRVRAVGEREYSCSGTPADCVILALLGAIPFDPDIVISGINRGPNLGTDIVYSGTCGAARQAALNGLPGIAVSCAAYKEPLAYGRAAAFISRRLVELVAHCSDSVFINVNAPSSDSPDISGEWTRPCYRMYRDRLKSFEAPDGYQYCFLSDSRIETIGDGATDHGAIAAGKISISPVMIHPQVPAGFEAGKAFR
jgi:5'-nucleotidase